MVKSMTAFARSSVQSAEIEINWEIKTVNQRYLEITMRLPEPLRQLEMNARELIQNSLGRGKLEASCRYRFKEQSASGLPIDSEKVNAVIAACNEIEMQMGGIGKTLSALDVLQYPGVVGAQNAEITDSELVLEGLSACLDDLQLNRQAEGERMQVVILDRAEAIEKIVQQVRVNRPEVIASMQNKLRMRVSELLKNEGTENHENERLEQELVMLAQKMDVDEELDRIDSHLVELRNVFERNEPIGRRLDFLMQEFNREANTLGSKSANVETTQAAVELKVLIEQMREQVQNIE